MSAYIPKRVFGEVKNSNVLCSATLFEKMGFLVAQRRRFQVQSSLVVLGFEPVISILRVLCPDH